MYKKYKVLAALLAALLVLAAGAAAEMVRSGQTYYTDLRGMVKNVSITGAEVNGNTWTVRPDTPYDMTVSFQETGSKQLDMNADHFTYRLPEGIVLSPQQGNGSIGFSYRDKNYDIPFQYSVAQDRAVTITPDYDEFLASLEDMSEDEKRGILDAFKRSTDTNINLRIEGQFHEEEVRLDWGNEVTTDVQLKHGVQVEKTADYERNDGYVHYKLTVTSEGNNKNIVVKDNITGNALEFQNDVSITWEPAAGSSTCTPNPNTDATFEYKINSMTDNQVVTFEYSAKINYNADPDNGTLTYNQTKNTATVKGDKIDDKQVNQGHSIQYSSVSKGSGQVTEVDGDTQTVTWTVDVNKEMKVSIAGTTLTDRITSNNPRMSYSGDFITVMVYDANGLVEKREVLWGSLEEKDDKHYVYRFPDTDGIYYYKIMYTTDVNVSGLQGSGSVTNKAEGHYGSSNGYTGITNGDEPGISKNVVEYDVNYVTWQVTIQVPESGLSEQYYELRDQLPNRNNEPFYSDEYKEGSIDVSGLDGVGYYTGPIITNINNKPFLIIRFFKPDGTPGLLGTGKPYEVKVTFTTKNNKDWLELAADVPEAKMHINQVDLGGKSGSAIVNLASFVNKKYGEMVTVGEDENAVRYIPYDIVIGGVTPGDTSITIRDEFDTSVFRVPTSEEARTLWLDEFFVAKGGVSKDGQSSDSHNVVYSNTDDGIEIIVTDIPKNPPATGENFPFIRVHYWLALKDGIDPDKIAHNSPGGKWKTTNTAYWNDSSDEVTFTYDYDYLTKELTNKSDILGGSHTAKYRITYNLGKGMINNGEPIILKDTWLPSLNIDYSSIKITTDPAERDADVSYTISGYTATYTIPDQTAVTIEYNALIIGTGDNIRISNTASDGYREVITDHSFTMGSSGSSSGIYFPAIKVDGNNNRIRIPGVRFKLTAPDRFSLKEGEELYEIELVTNSEGIIAIDQSKYNFYYYDVRKDMPGERFDENDPSTYVTYTLTELEPPAGYSALGESYTLSFTNDPNKVSFGNGKYIYYNSGQSVQIKNKALAGLIVRKQTVSDESRDKDQAFQFTVTLDADTLINGKYGDDDHGITFKDSVATFFLKDGEYIQADGLPSGIKYTIVETGADGFRTVSTGRTGDGGTLPTGGATFTGTTLIEGTEVTFKNTKPSPSECSVTFGATKVITGRKLTGDEFTFAVYEDGETDPIQTVKNDENGVVSFDEISYTLEDVGTHTYTVKEVVPEGVTAENPTKDGITYDLTSYTITVDVVDYGDGTLGAGIISITENK